MKNVSKLFDRQLAVENVNLSIHTGSIYGLIGSNGAGKTTLIKLLAGIYRQEKGEVMIDGQPVYENISLKQKIFYISDQPFFLAQYTTREMANLYKNLYPNWCEERFKKLVQSFDLNINKKYNHFQRAGKDRPHSFLPFLPSLIFSSLMNQWMGLIPLLEKSEELNDSGCCR